jgi:hypothetical protein
MAEHKENEWVINTLKLVFTINRETNSNYWAKYPAAVHGNNSEFMEHCYKEIQKGIAGGL